MGRTTSPLNYKKKKMFKYIQYNVLKIEPNRLVQSIETGNGTEFDQPLKTVIGSKPKLNWKNQIESFKNCSNQRTGVDFIKSSISNKCIKLIFNFYFYF